MIRFAENLNKMIAAGLGGAMEAPRTEVAVGHCIRYLKASGPVASFETNVVAPLKKLLVNMLPVQAGSGDPSPDNVRPITGRESVTVTRSGINIWDEEWEVGAYSSVNGDKTNASDRIRSKNFIPVLPNAQCFITRGLQIYFYTADKTYINWSSIDSSGVITIRKNAYYITFNALANTGTTYNHDISINYPSTDHDYHPGTVASVEVQLGQTVYGGKAEIISGQGESSSAYVEIGADADWLMSDAGKFYVNDVTSGAKITTSGYISNRYLFEGDGNTWSNNVTTDKRFYGQERYDRIWVYDSAYSTLEDFKASLSENPLQICYPLADPVTFTLDPATMSTLVGANNIWSDAGDVTLEYPYYEETEGY